MKEVVLHLIETGGPGGAERMLIQMVERLAASGYESLVCLLRDGWLERQLRERGVETVILAQKEGKLDPAWLLRCRRFLKARRVSLIHSHEFAMNAYAGLASVASGIPHVATVHGKNYYWEKWRRRAAYRFVAWRSRMVAVSRDIRRFLVERVGVREDRVSTIHNGIDTRIYRRGNGTGLRIRKALGLAESQPVVGTVGNLYEVKGHPILLEAAVRVKREVPEATFIIAGRGHLLEPLQARARELEIEDAVRFLGFREDVPDLLQAMDIFVLPSHSEGLPLSLLEAMASGKPAVATEVGGNPEVIAEGETGFLVPPADPSALAGRIIRLLRDRDLAARLGENGRARVEKEFSIATMVERYLELYRSRGRGGR